MKGAINVNARKMPLRSHFSMLRILNQIAATCFFLASCTLPKSPTKPNAVEHFKADCLESNHAAGKSALERAVLELPSVAVADIPRSQRAIFLAHLRSDGPTGRRLDVNNGFLDFHSDGEVPFLASSMLYMKVFPHEDGGSIVFCHMPKPQADTLPPRPGQTFFFAEREGKWMNVTKEILPKGIDVLWLFRHSRFSNALQTGPYNIWKKPDGKSACGGDAQRLMDLIWNGKSFDARAAKSPKFDYDG